MLKLSDLKTNVQYIQRLFLKNKTIQSVTSTICTVLRMYSFKRRLLRFKTGHETKWRYSRFHQWIWFCIEDTFVQFDNRVKTIDSCLTYVLFIKVTTYPSLRCLTLPASSLWPGVDVGVIVRGGGGRGIGALFNVSLGCGVC